MTFIDKLKAHIGGLVRIKKELYWYNRQESDKNPGRICLVLAATDQHFPAAAQVSNLAPAAADLYALAQLVIDGQPYWVWLIDKYVELIPDGSQKIF